MTTLTPDDVQRYKRHLVLRDVGADGQQKLKAARVLIIGVGGLGSPVLLYLAAAGVGTIGIIDDDLVSIDNLQRQVAHTTSRNGMPKVESAVEAVRNLNPLVKVEPIQARLTADNALDIISRYDLVADGSDNFATRYLVADACYFARKPLIYAALGPLDGYVSVFRPYDKKADGSPYPTLRCLFPEAPPAGLVANCSEVGVLGPIAGVIGTLQATEAVKELLNLGNSLAGRLLIYDGLASRFETIDVGWDSNNALTGQSATILNLDTHRRPSTSACAAK